MTAREFCYWLQGMYELNAPNSGLTEIQTKKIKNHLDMVFVHDIDPSYPEGQQETLHSIHNNGGDGFPYGPPKMRC